MPYKPSRYWSCHAGASQQGASTVISAHPMLELMLCANSPSESRLLTLKKEGKQNSLHMSHWQENTETGWAGWE